ncbi:MAG: molecular chaperone DnaJ, partial [bacterium]
FKEIAQAYEILSDPEKRGAYDQYGFAGVGAGAQGGPGFGGFDFSGGGGNFEDLFSAFFGGFGGRGTRQRGGPQPGSDLQVVVALTLEEVMEGVTRDLHYSRETTCTVCNGNGAKAGTTPQTCTECGGSGQVQFQRGGFLRISQPCPRCHGRGQTVTDPCATCQGSGKQQKDETISVRIPPGVSNNTQIRLDARGEAGLFGGPPGDLYVITRVSEHQLFERRGDNLYVEVPVTFSEAALGARIEVPTLKGTERTTHIKIPPATQTGTQFRLREYGLPHLNGRGKGDQFVVTTIATPKNLSSREKQLLKDLGDAGTEHPREKLLKTVKGGK